MTKPDFSPQVGQEVFLSDGRRAAFAGNIDGQIFVRMMLYSDDEYGHEEWPSDKLTPVSKVYANEPNEAYGPKISAAMEELQGIRDQAALTRTNLLDLQKREGEVRAAIARHPDLSTAIDFLEGRITHVVIERYGEVCIEEFEQSIKQKSDYGKAEGLKLVCLHGIDSDRKVRWSMNCYSDGSGSNTAIYPFKGRDAAEEFVRDRHRAEIELWRRGDKNHGVYRFLKCPVDLQWPEDFMAERAAAKRKNAEDRIAYFKKQMEPYEAELAELVA